MNPIAPDMADRLDSVLCIGAHADDIELGCSGTLLRLARANPALRVTYVVLSATGERADEASAAAAKLLGDADVHIEAFTERHFPAIFGELKDWFDELGRSVSPDLVLTPRRADDHQDHRTTAELTWQTFRAQPILEYEIVKYEGDLGRPNVYVALPDDIVEEKLALLAEVYPSQLGRYWYTEETFRGIMRIRGVECRAPSGYAEAFHGAKLRLL